VAQPGTITASIGVLGGKLLTTGFWDKLGISWDDVHSSSHSTQWTGTHDYSPAEYERFQSALDRIYEDFTQKVAQGRSLDLEQVQKIARGRIWTGADALDIGLVDALGGYSVALDEVRRALGLGADAPLRIKTFPRQRGVLDQFLGHEAENSESSAVAVTAALLRSIQPAVRLLQQAGILERREVLMMTEVPPHP
jgi:protease-4